MLTGFASGKRRDDLQGRVKVFSISQNKFQKTKITFYDGKKVVIKILK